MNLCEVSKDPKVYNVILVLTKIFFSLNYQVNKHCNSCLLINKKL